MCPIYYGSFLDEESSPRYRNQSLSGTGCRTRCSGGLCPYSKWEGPGLWKEVRTIDAKDGEGGGGVQSEQNVPSVGLLIKGLDDSPPETDVAGKK